MTGRTLLIINPNASKGKGRTKAGLIRELFDRAGHELDIAYTEREGHAEELALEAAENGAETVIAAGGDGCVNEVINGIMKSSRREEVKMGIIPIGRGNDYAYSLGLDIPLEDAVGKILAGKGMKVDIGISKGGAFPEGRYFANGNGFGFEPLVNYRAMQFKHLNGMASYIAAFLQIMVTPPRPYDVTLVTDREEVKIRTQQISVCIGERMGSVFKLAPGAIVDDGRFDFMYTKKPFTRFTILTAVLRFLRGTHLKAKETFEGYHATKITIRSERAEIYSHCDGEMTAKGDGKDYEIEILPSALWVYC